MLDKTSKALFKYLFRQLNDGKKLFALSEIINLFNEEINDTNVRSYLLNIEREGFIDIIFTDKKGEPYAFISLKSRGNDYFEDKKKRKKEVFMRILLAFLSALITYIAGRVLYRFFN